MPSKRLKDHPLNEDIYDNLHELGEFIQWVTNRPWGKWTIQFLLVCIVMILMSVILIKWG